MLKCKRSGFIFLFLQIVDVCCKCNHILYPFMHEITYHLCIYMYIYLCILCMYLYKYMPEIFLRESLSLVSSPYYTPYINMIRSQNMKQIHVNIPFVNSTQHPRVGCQLQACSGGVRYPCAPLDKHPPRPPLQPEVCSNLLNSKHIYSDFLFFLSIDNVTICPFYVHFSNSFLYLVILFTLFFSRGFI